MTDITTSNDWGVRLPLGNRWFHLSLGDEPDMDRLKAQVDARIGREPRLLESRQKLIDMLVYFSRDATNRGVAAAAMRWALDELDGVSVASLYMSSYKDNLVGDIDELIEFLQVRMSPRHANDRGDPLVEVRELAAGRAVRVEVMTDNEAHPQEDQTVDQDEALSADGYRRAVVLETVQYWFPVPGQDIIVVLTFTTPNLAGADALVGEFDQVVENLWITGPDHSDG